MVVSISISFGDLVALSDLVRKLIVALNNSRGATHDFRSFGIAHVPRVRESPSRYQEKDFMGPKP